MKISLSEIKSMSVNRFRKNLEKSIKIKSFEYLGGKRGSKGIEIKYSCLKMAEYLLPNEELTISEKRFIFSMRNRMVKIGNNFPGKIKSNTCPCGQFEDMKHIYTCKIYNKENENEQYEKIFEDNIIKQKIICERFRINIERKQNIENNSHVIRKVDPLYNDCTVMEIN